MWTTQWTKSQSMTITDWMREIRPTGALRLHCSHCSLASVGLRCGSQGNPIPSTPWLWGRTSPTRLVRSPLMSAHRDPMGAEEWLKPKWELMCKLLYIQILEQESSYMVGFHLWVSAVDWKPDEKNNLLYRICMRKAWFSAHKEPCVSHMCTCFSLLWGDGVIHWFFYCAFSL